MKYIKINGEHFYNMMICASNRLEEQKEFVNSLNVFPVPDGDTGTNMSMTFKAAVENLKNLHNESIGEVSKILAKGALMGARGNSGVILSQILRGIAKGLENKTEVDSKEFAESLMEGSRSAYKAVMRPTEGTILTIIRAAGESALNSPAEDITMLLQEVCTHSKNMLNKTPEMLPVLKKANVVDAGGMGLLILLNGMLEAMKDNLEDRMQLSSSTNTNVSFVQAFSDEEIKFGYCTEFLILSEYQDINSFREELELQGDSIIVVGFEDIVKVHIHTNDPGKVLSRALKIGALSKIKIDNMREQHRHLLVDEKSLTTEDVVTTEDPKEYGFISVAMGEGIVNIFKDLGVDYVIEGGQTMNPSTQDILDCINKLNAKSIFVLPNNKNIIMSATQAAELSEKNVVVIPSRTIPQGITAVTVYNSEVALDENIEMMNSSLKKVSSGTVTYAVRDTEMEGKEIKEGNILGLIEGKISEVGNSSYEVCENLISDMVNDDSELITIFYGEDCEEELVKQMLNKLEIKYKHMDVQGYKGQQPLYYFILAVE